MNLNFNRIAQATDHSPEVWEARNVLGFVYTAVVMPKFVELNISRRGDATFAGQQKTLKEAIEQARLHNVAFTEMYEESLDIEFIVRSKTQTKSGTFLILEQRIDSKNTIKIELNTHQAKQFNINTLFTLMANGTLKANKKTECGEFPG